MLLNMWTASSKRQSKAQASPTRLMRRTPRAPSRHKTQYFEMMGQWALFHEGWLLSTQGEPRAVGGLRPSQSRPAEQPGPRTLQPEQGLQSIAEHRCQVSRQGEGVEGDVYRRRRESIRSSQWTPRSRPASSLRGRTSPPAEQSSSTPADGRPAAGRFANLAQQFLHHHRGHRSARRRRRRDDPDLRRPVCRVWLLLAQRQAGLPLEPGRPEAHQVGRPRGTRTR